MAMTSSTPDRSDLHLGLQHVLFGVQDGASSWKFAVAEVDLDAIDGEDSMAFHEFRRHVPQEKLPTHVLLRMGRIARERGIANVVREKPTTLPNGRVFNALPPLGKDWAMIDHIFYPLPKTSVVTSQGVNSCSIDVVLFLSVCFNFGRTRADARSLGVLCNSTRTHFAFRQVMAHFGYGKGPKDLVLKQNRQLREILSSTMAAASPQTIFLDCFNDLGEVAGHCWDNLRSLTYTSIPTFICCGKVELQDADSVPRRYTSHNITLENYGKHDKPASVFHPGKSLAEVVRNRYFSCETPEVANRTPNGDVLTPFAPCPGRASTCLQLPTKMVRLLDDVPPYLFVSVDNGGAVKDDNTRKYMHPLEIEVFTESIHGRVKVAWVVSAIGIYRPSRAHFFGRAYSPPGFPEFQNALCEFDGTRSYEPQRIKGTSLMEGLLAEDRITVLVYTRRSMRGS